MATVALAEGQLDLFADLDAAATAAAEAEAQRRFDEAPSMFDNSVRGFFARVAAAEAWSDEHGHFDCLRRSHAWRAEIGGSRSEQPTGVCRPITLTADLRCEHYRDERSCIGDLVYR